MLAGSPFWGVQRLVEAVREESHTGNGLAKEGNWREEGSSKQQDSAARSWGDQGVKRELV